MAKTAEEIFCPSLRALAKGCGVARRTLDNWRAHHKWRWHDPPYPVHEILAWRGSTFAIDNAAAMRTGAGNTAKAAKPKDKKQTPRAKANKKELDSHPATDGLNCGNDGVETAGKTAAKIQGAPAEAEARRTPQGAAEDKLAQDILYKKEQVRKLEFDNAVKEGLYVLRTEYDNDMGMLSTIFVQSLNDLQQSLPLQLISLEAAEISQVLIEKFDNIRRQIVDRVENNRGRVKQEAKTKARAGRPHANRAT